MLVSRPMVNKLYRSASARCAGQWVLSPGWRGVIRCGECGGKARRVDHQVYGPVGRSRLISASSQGRLTYPVHIRVHTALRLSALSTGRHGRSPYRAYAQCATRHTTLFSASAALQAQPERAGVRHSLVNGSPAVHPSRAGGSAGSGGCTRAPAGHEIGIRRQRRWRASRIRARGSCSRFQVHRLGGINQAGPQLR